MACVSQSPDRDFNGDNMEIADQDTTRLGKTDLCIPNAGTGAWAWGDRTVWGYGRDYQENDVRGAFEASLQSGINFFDTAEVYGMGRSERLLGAFLQERFSAADEPHSRQNFIIATKFMPFPWRLWKGLLIRALKNSLKRLQLTYVDLYQIHFPMPPIPVEIWAEALAEAVEQGLTKSVGVSNYNEQQMRQAHLTLMKHDIHLASNQVEYHLLNRKVELNGLLETCRDLGITLIAYSPLAQGVLTGKYTPEKPPPGVRGRHYNRSYLAKIQPLLRLLRDIGREHDGKSPAQVALNWVICKGAVPIPGAKNERQTLENAGALGWQLTDAEVAILDEASLNASTQK
jgi:aryl-alcohol dehydrogenase-like predicted oxidoreductase